MRRPGSATAAGGAAGLVVGTITARALFLKWWTLVPWALAPLALGWVVPFASSAASGALYGVVMVISFLVLTGGGVTNRLPFLAALGFVGAMSGAVLAFVGAVARRRGQRPRRSNG